jgi:hypothetical protein
MTSKSLCSALTEGETMSSLSEKGGGVFAGIKLLLYENPLPIRASSPRFGSYCEW